jgi:hypothetical protein
MADRGPVEAEGGYFSSMGGGEGGGVISTRDDTGTEVVSNLITAVHVNAVLDLDTIGGGDQFLQNTSIGAGDLAGRRAGL